MLTRSLLLAGLRDLLRRPLHTALLITGIALGVAMVVAIAIASEAAGLAFERSNAAVVGRATHQLRGGSLGLEEDLLRRLRVELGLRQSAPIVEGVVFASDLGRRPLRILGLDVLSEGPFRAQVSSASLRTEGFGALLAEPATALAGGRWAAELGLRPGSRLRVGVAGRAAEIELLGLLSAEDEGLDGVLLMDVGNAQNLLGQRGRLTRIDLILTNTEAERVAAWAPAGVSLRPASEQAQTAQQLTAAFRLNLQALSLLALVVGVFLVYNTVTFSVVQRRAVFGTLRALGTTPRQVLALVLAEAAAAGLLGGALGVLGGALLGHGAVRLVTRTINDLYFALHVRSAGVSWTVAVAGVLCGVLAATLAALGPGLEAAHVDPLEALRASLPPGLRRRRVTAVSLLGLLIALAGGLLLGLAERSLPLSFAGLFALLLGLALLAPLALLGFLRAADALLGQRLSVVGRMALRSAPRAIGRTGVATAALMVAIATTVGVTLMIGSFRSTLVGWLAVTLRSDVYVSLPGGPGARGSFGPDLSTRVGAMPGVARVDTVRQVEVEGPLGRLQLAVTDAPTEASEKLYRVSPGTAGTGWLRLRRGAVLVSEPFAHRYAIPERGGQVVLRTDRGSHTFEVAGIYYDYATERGTILMHRDVYERHFDDRQLSAVGVTAQPGVPVEEVARGIRAALLDTGLEVTSNASLRRTALKIFDRTFLVTEALRGLAVLVAFIGVWSALLALLSERTRELATLQALGLDPRGLARLVLAESGLLGLVAGLLSWPTGALLALVLVHVINVRSFGWTLAFELQPSVFAQALLVSVGAALLGGWAALARLRRLPVAAALRGE